MDMRSRNQYLKELQKKIFSGSIQERESVLLLLIEPSNIKRRFCTTEENITERIIPSSIKGYP